MGNRQTTTAGLTEGPFPEGMEKEAFFGLDNFGATCYLNSVMQALYACTLLRGKILDYFENLVGSVDVDDESLLNQVAELFNEMTYGVETAGEKPEGKLLTGSLSPENLYNLVLEKNCLFMRHQQQDAQEFLIFMLNTLTEELSEIERKKRKHRRSLGELMEEDQIDISSSDEEDDQQEIVTWIQDIFGGKLINETQCLRCENVQNREEDFMDLSLQIPGSVSLNECLRKFSHATLLNESNKYECLKCRCKQEAFSRMRIKSPPQVLVIHLKRFQYIEEYRSFRKLFDRVEFPFNLKLINTVESSPETEFTYRLFGVVIHIGDGPRMGHYQAMVKRIGHWYLYDDEYISLGSEEDVREKFGGTRSTAYLLFYER